MYKVSVVNGCMVRALLQLSGEITASARLKTYFTYSTLTAQTTIAHAPCGELDLAAGTGVSRIADALRSLGGRQTHADAVVVAQRAPDARRRVGAGARAVGAKVAGAAFARRD